MNKKSPGQFNVNSVLITVVMALVGVIGSEIKDKQDKALVAIGQIQVDSAAMKQQIIGVASDEAKQESKEAGDVKSLWERISVRNQSTIPKVK